MYAIRRLNAAINAWCWVVAFRRRGRPYSRRFYDLKYGSSARARLAAVAWRDRTLARAKVLTRREFCEQKRSNNRSGVPGVHFAKEPKHPPGRWQAKTRLPDGRKFTKSFAVSKYGEREAFRRAVAAREELLLLVEDRPYIKHPTAKEFLAKRATHVHRD